MQTVSSITPIPSLFSANSNFAISHESGNSINYQTGIPSIFSLSIDSGGSYITRAMVNTLARAISSAQFLHQCGHINTFDSSVSSAIGGYPLGAILDYYYTMSNSVRKVRSLISNNTYDFTSDISYIDNEKWAFADNIKPITTVFDM